jgi:hypothetical protein
LRIVVRRHHELDDSIEDVNSELGAVGKEVPHRNIEIIGAVFLAWLVEPRQQGRATRLATLDDVLVDGAK